MSAVENRMSRGKRSPMKRTLAALAVVLASACASSQPGAESVVTIAVENNTIPPGPVTVYLVPGGGIERILGTAPSSRITTLQYRGLAPVGEHRLVARAISGRTIASNTFLMDGVQAIEWSLASNFVQIKQTRQN